MDKAQLEERVKELETELKVMTRRADEHLERWKKAKAKYPNGAEGCCCLFDKDEKQINWCSVHAELRDERARCMNPIKLAILFHDLYEALAPEYGYQTREETKVFDSSSPNGRLMIAVCRELQKYVHIYKRKEAVNDRHQQEAM
jgi:hypothetical protein